MEPVQYLRALRQWWQVIVALTLVGFIAAFALTKTPVPEYTATHTIALDGTNTDSVTLSRAAFLTTTGQVQAQANAKLGPPEPDVTATADSDLNGLQITATAATPERAVQVADTYTAELVAFLQNAAVTQYNAELATAQADVNTAAAAFAASGSNVNSPASSKYNSAVAHLQDLESQGTPTSGFSTLGTTSVDTVGGGSSRTSRAIIGGLVGFFLGVLLALVLARFDTRIRTRESAEAAFGVPVVAEIPMLPRKLRKQHAIVTESDPESLSAEAYRSLRTALVVSSSAARTPDASRGTYNASAYGRPLDWPHERSQPERGRVIMVVSPGTSEGKTTTSANLAVAFAETGRSVLLLGLDLRRPELHQYFGLSEQPGMTDLLADHDPHRALSDVVRATPYPGITIATSGVPVEHPGELLARSLDLIASARVLADIVIIDTAPLLATDDAGVIMPLVDEVVLVCRSGRTPNDASRRARELLARLQAPLVGVTLIGVQSLRGSKSYYRSEYRSRKPPAHRGSREPSPVVTPVDPAPMATNGHGPIVYPAPSPEPSQPRRGS